MILTSTNVASVTEKVSVAKWTHRLLVVICFRVSRETYNAFYCSVSCAYGRNALLCLIVPEREQNKSRELFYRAQLRTIMPVSPLLTLPSDLLLHMLQAHFTCREDLNGYKGLAVMHYHRLREFETIAKFKDYYASLPLVAPARLSLTRESMRVTPGTDFYGNAVVEHYTDAVHYHLSMEVLSENDESVEIEISAHNTHAPAPHPLVPEKYARHLMLVSTVDGFHDALNQQLPDVAWASRRYNLERLPLAPDSKYYAQDTKLERRARVEIPKTGRNRASVRVVSSKDYDKRVDRGRSTFVWFVDDQGQLFCNLFQTVSEAEESARRLRIQNTFQGFHSSVGGCVLKDEEWFLLPSNNKIGSYLKRTP